MPTSTDFRSTTQRCPCTVVVVPAFAVGRAQALMYLISVLKHERRIPDLPVFLDSPMAANATDIHRKHATASAAGTRVPLDARQVAAAAAA